MNQAQDKVQVYLCPMHSEVRQPDPGKCPRCGMDLLPEGTRFGMLRHMAKNPVMVIVMVAIMAVIMAGPMMMMR
jgi:hypothetical protein